MNPKIHQCIDAEGKIRCDWAVLYEDKVEGVLVFCLQYRNDILKPKKLKWCPKFKEMTR